jgi:hypothetical protein
MPHLFGIREICNLIILYDRNIMEKRLKIVSVKGKDITVLIWVSIVAYMTLTGFLLPDVYSQFAITAGWFAAGLMCLWNFRSCGRYHCAITGPGFLGIGILSLIEALDIINLQEWIEWSIFLAVLAIGFGLEYAQRLIYLYRILYYEARK